MKKAITMMAIFAASSFAASFKGTITDEKCGVKHADASAASVACSKKCVDGGAAPVLVVGETVMKFDDASKAKIASFVGSKVVVKGKAKDGVITVASVKAAKM